VSGVRIRAFEPRDLEQQLALLERCFDGLSMDRERERRRWALEENPAHDPRLPAAWIAESEGVLIGTYGLLPLRFLADGEVQPGLAGVDFCVAPEARGRGVGRMLSDAFLASPGSRLRLITSPTEATVALMRARGAGGRLVAGGRRVDDRSERPSGVRVRVGGCPRRSRGCARLADAASAPSMSTDRRADFPKMSYSCHYRSAVAVQRVIAARDRRWSRPSISWKRRSAPSRRRRSGLGAATQLLKRLRVGGGAGLALSGAHRSHTVNRQGRLGLGRVRTGLCPQ
jgi:GNAT superfamily N-acetyltransferase